MKKNGSDDAALKLLDVVALLKDVPSEKLTKGQVGTIVEELDADFYEVEFTDIKGKTINSLALNGQNMMLLKFETEEAV